MQPAPIPRDELARPSGLRALKLLATPRDVGFRAHTMLEPGPMAVPDATTDPRFADNPFVAGASHLRCYAGGPLHGPRGRPIGALPLVDTRPREFSSRHLGHLRKFAASVGHEMAR